MAAKKNSAPEKSAPISDAAVVAKTGRGWQEWVKALDAAGAPEMTHAEIAKLVSREFGVGPWWSQMVTVGYEQLKGRRRTMQRADGYAVGASRTIAAPLQAVFSAAAGRAADWLPPGVVIHRATAPKSMRATDPQGRKTISLNFYAKGEAKALVMVQQDKLASQAETRRVKETWATSLRALESRIVPPPRAEKPRASRTRARTPPRRK